MSKAKHYTFFSCELNMGHIICANANNYFELFRTNSSILSGVDDYATHYNGPVFRSAKDGLKVRSEN